MCARIRVFYYVKHNLPT